MSRGLILSLLLFFLGVSCVHAENYLPDMQQVNGDNGMQNYGSNITSVKDPFAKSPATGFPDLSEIESSLYGRNYPSQKMSSRLSRIEKSLFNATYPNSTNLQRIDNIISNFNQINKYPNISKSTLSKIETQIFNQKYSMNNPQRRIERLEENLFGATQSGDLNTRFNNVQQAVKAYASNSNPALNNIYPNYNTPRTGWKGLSGNLGNALLGGGSMTGFTPPLNPYFNQNNCNMYNRNAFPTNTTVYNNAGYNPYNNFGLGGSSNANNQSIRSNRGYYEGSGMQNFSSGAGVTILD